MTEKIQDFSEVSSDGQNSWTSSDPIHSDLLATKDFVFNPCRFDSSPPQIEEQNAEYGAYVFNLNGNP
ncbi:hypothetical protein ACFPYN_03820 [Paenisporosarcina macmurdoensis]|uniref:Uncharacterized protein n=1 Tax=Paenisporosarcina macmurdoensis TaxID=212659 RepID=A0ABW1L3I8_9BACL